MRTGILTFHYSCNYGGVLQAYALQRVLASLGHDVKIIDFVPSNFKRSWKYYIPRHLDKRNLWIKWKQISKFAGLVRSFERFRREYMDLTERLNETTISSVNDKFDVIISGSDQVWNPYQHDKGIYFLNWKPFFNGKRISYAPCCAVNKVAPANYQIVKNALVRFDSISVRNEETSLFVQSLIEKTPTMVADPTILHSFVEFATTEEKYAFEKEHYILVYVLGKDIKGGNENAIAELKEKYANSKVVALQSILDNPQYTRWADYEIYDASPADWVRLIAHAECVYTDSFHATIFSMKFNRNFVCYYSEPQRASRFLDMKERYGIEKNLVVSCEELINKPIDDFRTPSLSVKAFSKQREHSLSYLIENLN